MMGSQIRNVHLMLVGMAFVSILTVTLAIVAVLRDAQFLVGHHRLVLLLPEKTVCLEECTLATRPMGYQLVIQSTIKNACIPFLLIHKYQKLVLVKMVIIIPSSGAIVPTRPVEYMLFGPYKELPIFFQFIQIRIFRLILQFLYVKEFITMKP